MAIAFFDLDRTVLSVNSGTLWVKSEMRLGFISWTQALRAYGWIAAYQLGFARMEKALLLSIATLEGVLEEQVVARTQAFYLREVRDRVRPGALSALRRHREEGDRRVLLTSSSNYLSQSVSAQLELDDYLCNRFEVAGGRYTGRPLGSLCYGAGKVEHARAYAQARGIALSACAFYTDSVSDLPMLEAVGRPVAVHPDPALRRIARSRGWEIADWGETREPAR